MDVIKFVDGKFLHERRAKPIRNRFEKKLCRTGSKYQKKRPIIGLRVRY